METGSQPEESTPRRGAISDLTSDEARSAAIDAAFEYRGDVTITTTDGRTIEGYVFDRCSDGPQAQLRIIPGDGSGRLTVAYDQIDRLEFTGRDTAEGKSWETWLRQYQEKKARGELANIDPEPIE